MVKQLLIILPLIVLTSCSQLPLGAFGFGGGGTNVAANTQVGKENRQAFASFESGYTSGRDIVTKQLEAGPVDSLTINNQDIPIWVIFSGMLMFILWSYLLWILPSPNEIWRKNK